MATTASRRGFFGKLVTQCVRSFEHGHATGVFNNQGYDITTPASPKAVLCFPAAYKIPASPDLALAGFTRLPQSWQDAQTHFKTASVCVLTPTPIANLTGIDRLIVLNPPSDFVAPCPVLLVFDAAENTSAALSLIQIARQPAGSDVFYGSMDWYDGAPLSERIHQFALNSGG